MPEAVVAITLGDSAGVGAEVVARSVADPRVNERCRYVIVGSARRLALAIDVTRVALDLRVVGDIGRAHHEPGIADVIDVPSPHVPWGEPSAEASRALIAALRHAVRFCQVGAAKGIATAPAGKAALRQGGLASGVGQTAVLEQATGTTDTVMLLVARVGDRVMRAAHVTTHLPLREVPGAYTRQRLRHVLTTTAVALRREGIAKPRIAVAGLNPHAGEDGVLGDEESRVVVPTVRWARARGLDVVGPLPNETIWVGQSYDAIVVAYHDAGHTPLRTAAGHAGLHLTLGLPFPRSAPLHGTGYHLAGTGRADPSAMMDAILAVAAPRALHR